jgi:hypothetical protein
MSGYQYLDMLQGARIERATREGPWLVLATDRGVFMAAGGRVRVDLECPRCAEFRLVEIVETGGKQEGVCAVCAYAWTIHPRAGSTGE